MIAALRARGVRVFALAPDYDQRSWEAVKKLDAEPVAYSLQRAGMSPSRDLIDAYKLYRKLNQLKPDAALCYFIKPVLYGTIAAAFAGVSRRYALIAGLGHVYTPASERETFKRTCLRFAVSLLYRVALAMCHRVFFQNQDDIKEFRRRRLINVNKIVSLTGTGVDLERIGIAPPVYEPITFLMMARLLREKGVYEYIEAAKIIGARHRGVKFVLLGDVDDNPSSISFPEVKRWMAEGVIEWPGHVEDVTQWIAAASVYVLPSYREGKPRSTQEAMAMGRPVITTDAPGCRETVIEGETGYLVPVRDPEALAAAMERFIHCPELIRNMGAAGRAFAEKNFNVHEINRQMLTALGFGTAQQADSTHREQSVKAEDAITSS